MWRRLTLLALCALLLAAQQRLHLHALSHLDDEHAAAAAVPASGHDHDAGHEAGACAVCLATAAAAHLMPAAAGLAPQRAPAWCAPAAALALAERRANPATRHIRGPPLPPLLG